MVAEGKEIREFDGEQYVMERSLVPEVSLVKRTGPTGRATCSSADARNFNPGRHGRQDLRGGGGRDCGRDRRHGADQIHLPGIYRAPHRAERHARKRIERSAPITAKAGV